MGFDIGSVFNNFKKGAIAAASKMNNKKFSGINTCSICQAAANVFGNLQGLINLLNFGAGNCGGSGGKRASYGTTQRGSAYNGSTYYSESDKQKKGAAKKLGIKTVVYSSASENKKDEIKEVVDELEAVEKDIEDWVEEDLEKVIKIKIKLLIEITKLINILYKNKYKKTKFNKGDLSKKPIKELTQELLDEGLIDSDKKELIDNSGITGSLIDEIINGYIDSDYAKKIRRSNLFQELDESTQKALSNITNSDDNISHLKSIFSSDNSIRKNGYAKDTSNTIGNSSVASHGSNKGNTASLTSIYTDLVKNRGYDFIEKNFVADSHLLDFPNIGEREDYFKKLDEINNKHYDLKDMITELEDVKNIANLMQDVRSDGKALSDLISNFKTFYNQINFYSYYETGSYQNPNNRDGNYYFGNNQNYYITNINSTYIQNIIYNGQNNGVPIINWKGTGEDSSYLSNTRTKSSTSGDVNSHFGDGNDGKSNTYGDEESRINSYGNSSYDTGGSVSSETNSRSEGNVNNNPHGGSSATGNGGYTGDGGTGSNNRSWSSDGNGYQNGEKTNNSNYDGYNDYSSTKDDKYVNGDYSSTDSVADSSSYSSNSGNNDESNRNTSGGSSGSDSGNNVSNYGKNNNFAGNDNYNGSVTDIGKSVYKEDNGYSDGTTTNWWKSDNYNSRDIDAENKIETQKISIENNVEVPSKDDIENILNEKLITGDGSTGTGTGEDSGNGDGDARNTWNKITSSSNTRTEFYIDKTLNINKRETKLYNSKLATARGINSKGLNIDDEGLRQNQNNNAGWEQAENKLTAVINTVIRASESPGGGGNYTEDDLSEIIEEAETGYDIFTRYDPVVKKKLFCPEVGFVVDHYIVRDTKFASPIITESKLNNLKRVYNTLLKPIYIHFFDRAKTDGCVLNILAGLCSQPYAVACLGGHALSRHIFGQAVDFNISGLTPREVFDEIKDGTLPLDYGVLNLNENHIHITLPYNFKGRNVYKLNISPDIVANSDRDLNFVW